MWIEGEKKRLFMRKKWTRLAYVIGLLACTN